MPILGAHMSIAGGYYKAANAAGELGMDCVQLFSKNNNQWRARPISAEEADAFQAALAEQGVKHPLAHASYLINLASPDDALWEKSIDAFVVELQRADQLGLFGVVVHPGSFTTSCEAEGLDRISRALDKIHQQAAGAAALTLLENTAGQGSNLGWKFEHLGAIRAAVKQPARVGVCIDTCHAFAAGYAMETAAEYKATMQKLDDALGIQHVKAFHLNDSKRELGSRVDRHEHIGLGKIGEIPFRRLLRDARFQQIPMYMETPKDMHESGRPWDAVNLQRLRELAQHKKK